MSLSPCIRCLQCGKVYDGKERRPCVGTCSHSICSSCYDALDSSRCPICKTKSSFSADEKKIDLQLEKTLRMLRKNITYGLSLADFHKDMGEPDNGKCSSIKCGMWSKKLEICVDCNKLSKLFTKSKGAVCLKLTAGAEKKAETLERLKGIAICGACALEKHKGHKVVRMVAVPNVLGYISTLIFGSESGNEQEIVSFQAESTENELGFWKKRVEKLRKSVHSLILMKKTFRISTLEIGPFLPFKDPILHNRMRESTRQLAKWIRKGLQIRIFNFQMTREFAMKLMDELRFYQSFASDERVLEHTEAALLEVTGLNEVIRKYSLKKEVCEEISRELTTKREETEKRLAARAPVPRGEDPRLYFKMRLVVEILKDYAANFVAVKIQSLKAPEKREKEVGEYKTRLAELQTKIAELKNVEDGEELEEKLFDECRRNDEKIVDFLIGHDEKMMMLEKFAYSKFFAERVIATHFDPEKGPVERKYFNLIMDVYKNTEFFND